MARDCQRLEDKTTRIWNSTETGDAFAAACAGLGNETDLADSLTNTAFTELKPDLVASMRRTRLIS